MSKIIIALFIPLLLLNNSVFAHSIQFEITKQAPTVSIYAYFSQTAPVTGANVNIYAPEQNQPFQTGQTDKKGYFAFMPSYAGNWVFEIDDQHGHKNKVNISIDENFITGQIKIEASPKEKSEEIPATTVEEIENITIADLPFIYKLILGLALIFGVTGISYGIKARQSLKKT